MMNGVSVSAATQHIEAPINANNIHLDNQSRFCCQDQFFRPGSQFQTNLRPPPADLPVVGFFNGRFQSDNPASIVDVFSIHGLFIP